MKILTDEQIKYDLGNILGWLLKDYIKDVTQRELGEYGRIYPVISKKTGSIYFLGRIPPQLREILLSFDREEIMSLSDILTSLFMIGLVKDIYKNIKSDPTSPKVTVIFWKYLPDKKKISFEISNDERKGPL